MDATPRQLAVVTGASTGIGLELARLCAQERGDLIVAADEPLMENAARELAQSGIGFTAVQCDLATAEGVARLTAAIHATGRPVDALSANAGRGLGKGFLDQDLNDALKVIASPFAMPAPSLCQPLRYASPFDLRSARLLSM